MTGRNARPQGSRFAPFEPIDALFVALIADLEALLAAAATRPVDLDQVARAEAKLGVLE